MEVKKYDKRIHQCVLLMVAVEPHGGCCFSLWMSHLAHSLEEIQGNLKEEEELLGIKRD